MRKTGKAAKPRKTGGNIITRALKTLDEIGNVPAPGSRPRKLKAVDPGDAKPKTAGGPRKGALEGARQFFKSIFRKFGKNADVKDEAEIVDEVKRTVEKAEKSAARGKPRDGLRSVAAAFRHSMRQLLGVRYEFTFEELEKELDKKRLRTEIKESLRALSEKLDEMEYGDNALEKKGVKQLASDVKKVVFELVA